MCALTIWIVWSSRPNLSLTVFHWAPSRQHRVHHIQFIGFYFSIYPCNLLTEDTESIICRREFPLTEILRTVPTAEENTVPRPPCFSKLVVGNGGGIGSVFSVIYQSSKQAFPKGDQLGCFVFLSVIQKSQKTPFRKDTRTPVFNAAQVTTARTWMQPKGP